MTTTLTNRSRTTDETAWAKARALLVAAGPVLLTAALLWHPPLPGRLPDSAGYTFTIDGTLFDPRSDYQRVNLDVYLLYP